jgi:phosphatidate cytidylyltransferase
VTRVLSGAVLVAITIGVIWFAPPWLYFLAGELLLVGAYVEYARLAEAVGAGVPVVAGGVATGLVSIGVTSTLWVNDAPLGTAVFLDAALMSAFVVLATLSIGSWRGEREILARVSVSLFPTLYLGLPIGALIAVRSAHGREALMLLIATIAASDTAQYYTGRAFGRRPLAPAISPKKTIEGAVGGFVFGAAALAIAGRWWLPGAPAPFRAALGLAVVALGIAGDLFESMLKRAAGVKDSSRMIPGHGGVLDRIDALLFAAPVYYIVLKYLF